MSVKASELPDEALLIKYSNFAYADAAKAYTDCFSTQVGGNVPLADFINAFYTTWLFKLERCVIRYLAKKPSSDDDAAQLAKHSRQTFAVWTVEERSPNQLLLCDDHGQTRSWLMVQAIDDNDEAQTLLQFGSAVIPGLDKHTGKTELSTGFRMLLPLHRFYSRLLLGAARTRLCRISDDVK